MVISDSVQDFRKVNSLTKGDYSAPDKNYKVPRQNTHPLLFMRELCPAKYNYGQTFEFFAQMCQTVIGCTVRILCHELRTALIELAIPNMSASLTFYRVIGKFP